MSKKQFLVISLLSLFPFLIGGADNTLFYRNENSHFGFNLPDGWKQIEKNAIDRLNKETIKGGDLEIQVNSGFQRKSDYNFDYPFFTVRISKGKTSLDQIMEDLKNQKHTDGTKIVDLKIDRNNNCVIYKTVITDPGGVKVQILQVLFPGQYETVELIFNSNLLDRDESDINFILDNFNFDDGYGYTEESPIKKFIKNLDFTKIIVAVIFGFVLVYFAQRKKKKPYAPLGDWNEKNK